MCETLPDLVSTCLYHVPWLRQWVLYGWWLLFIFNAACMAATYLAWKDRRSTKSPKHLRLGWIAGEEQPSDPRQLLSDYRAWVGLFVLIGCWLSLCALLWYYWHPQDLLLGINLPWERSPWELSPAGVTLLKKHLYILGVGSAAWIATGVLGVIIIMFDPYSFMKYRLTLQSKDVEVLFDGDPLRQGTPREIHWRKIYVAPDGKQFSSKRQQDSWIPLTYEENSKCLGGKGSPPESGKVLWFHQAGSHQELPRGKGFCIGVNRDSSVHFFFK